MKRAERTNTNTPGKNIRRPILCFLMTFSFTRGVCSSIHFPMDFAKKEYQLKKTASKRIIGNLKITP
jgi:hypothetical protein